MAPQKIVHRICACDFIYLGKTFCRWVNLKISRWDHPALSWWASNLMTGVFIRERRYRHRWEGHVRTEAEIGVIQAPGTLGVTRNWKKQERILPLRILYLEEILPLGGSAALWTTWLWTSGLQNCETIHFFILSHQNFGSLLQQLWETNTNTKDSTPPPIVRG